jgi:uncharacterized cupredoxin-like copper-binding protein
MDRTARIAASVLGAAFVTATAACSSNGHSSGPGMMGGGSDTRYHYARLTCSAPSSLPGRTVTVTLADMGMTQMMDDTAPVGAHMMLRAAPTTVTAGQITFVAQNMGRRTHELVVLPLAAGAGDGILAGSVGWVTVTLLAGRYELMCNLPNHNGDGMRQELDVSNS